MYAQNLKTNYLKNPIGIDHGAVTFSWIPVDGAKQTAFQIIVSNGMKTVFDSGRIASSFTEFHPDFHFQSRTRYEWTITLCAPGAVSNAHFETTIAQGEWHAEWIDPELTQPT